MLANVVGKKLLNFTSKEGKVIDGTHFFVTYEDTDVEGLVAEKFFIPSTKIKANEVSIGDVVDISFTHKGKIDKIKVVDDIEI